MVCRVSKGVASDGILYMLWSTGTIFDALRSIISFKGLLIKQGFSFAKRILLASHTLLYQKAPRASSNFLSIFLKKLVFSLPKKETLPFDKNISNCFVLTLSSVFLPLFEDVRLWK